MSNVKTIAQHQAPAMIAQRKPFKASALTAELTPSGLWNSGRLYGEDYEQYQKDRENVRYVVFSYATPIAWVLANGDTYRVKGKFSRTTSSKHQSKLYML